MPIFVICFLLVFVGVFYKNVLQEEYNGFGYIK